MIEQQNIADLASKYINTTNRHLFLTGKAGTGKTTFLKGIIEHTHKNAIITAPTGIAAINAGGVTLHSLLQLPFGTFIPENIGLNSTSSRVNTPQTLFKQSRFNASKRKLIMELELLVIDEVSMLRADLLDCIDHALRFLRKRRNEPFGGLQMLFIGDLMQLPPVVKSEEVGLLNRYYPSMYFFEAQVMKKSPPVLVEFHKIYRQQDQQFIDLLNRIRNNQQTINDLQQLNKHYRESAELEGLKGYIHLTTHNHKADAINQKRLSQLKGKTFTFDAETQGEFPDSMLPTSNNLVLKEGAQVMFIKNDPSGEGQYFNGKIGQIAGLSSDKVSVRFENGDEIVVAPYKWENKRYVLDQAKLEVEEKFIGSFEQYPLKLAWAVTIHKSQGLTFEKAILDLSGTFAPGQLYVALSRLTSLKGLLLSSQLPEAPPAIDQSLLTLSAKFQDVEQLSESLIIDRKNYIHQSTKKAFDFSSLIAALGYHKSSFNKSENRSLKQQYLSWTQQLIEDTVPLKETGQKFILQVNQILNQENYLPQVTQRMEKAQAYFENSLTMLKNRIADHRNAIKGESKIKTYLKELEDLERLYLNHNQLILKVNLLVININYNKAFNRNDLKGSSVYQLDIKPLKKTVKRDKTPTAKITYELYRQGKDIEEIAAERGLVSSTIEGHLCAYVANGQLEVTEFLKVEKLNKIMDKFHKGATGIGDLKGALNNDFSYSEIKLALAHIKCLENAT